MAALGTSSPTSPRTAPCAVPTWSCCARWRPGPTSRWWPAVASPAWPIWKRCAAWCRSGSRARSSERRSTRVLSPCRRPWMQPAADSAGVPWAGRTLTGQPFTGDDGQAEPGLLGALTGWRDAADRAALTGVVRAWAPTRVLVPIVAVLGDGEDVRSAAELVQGDK